MKNPIQLIVASAICLCVHVACNNKHKSDHPFFVALPASETGLDFTNQMHPTPEFNLFSYMYYYNGAGVAAGDFNNDGLVDLFFSANQGKNKLYLNQGNMQFREVSDSAMIPANSGWSTGVSVIDINNDGLLDIYICKVGHYKSLSGKNELLVCKGLRNGVPYYADEAAQYGLDFSGFSTQAAFLDFDGDGDLDMFLLNHSVNHDGNYAPRKNFVNTYDAQAGQKLFRNDNGQFTDVTLQAGINGSKIGYGLGVAVADIDLDGWPDIYVGNDFHENDYLYINQHNGKFEEQNTKRLMHTSQFSMGVDVADINNDAYPDIISMDMLPSDPYILRRSLAEDDYNIFLQKIAYGYTYQYARNNLQLNRGNGMFSEVGQYAGIYATDWSWAALWMDYDNDGLKDVFISNGIPKRMNDIDYINFVSNEEVQQKLRDNSLQDKDMSLLKKFPEIKIPNKFYKNTGSASFTDVTDSVENNPVTFSNGALYADLDNDGDLDIVVNNIDDPVTVYKNTANDKGQRPAVAVKLQGDSLNRNAIGAKIVIFSNGETRTYENTPVHGFQSSALVPMVVGIANTKIDSSFLIWPDNSYEPIRLQKNISVQYRKGLPKFNYESLRNRFAAPVTLNDITDATGLIYKHEENQFNEFNREPLMPHMVSTEGPALAVADINHDGLEDVFVGSSKTFHNAVFLQRAGGKFSRLKEPALEQDSMWENTDAVWIDINNDSHPDLITASGGNEYYGEDEHLLPLAYLNDGKGNLTKKADAFAHIYVTQSVIKACDLNGDGFTDLFIGGRAMPWNFGIAPRSYLLLNDGSGKFKDVTKEYCADLLNRGLVTNAVWTDMNKDGKQDLVLTYEWGNIEMFLRNGKGFIKQAITDKNGWWNFALPVDIDNDGDLDIVAGNLGLNNKWKCDDDKPVTMYVNDFDDNGTKEQVITYFLNGKEIPFAAKQELEKQMPFLKKKFLYAADFAKAPLTKMFDGTKLDKAVKRTMNYLGNAVFINDGKMHFSLQTLPAAAQFSTFKTAVTTDVNKDGLPDVLLFGNYYDCNIQLGRCDADFGTVLLNKGKGQFDVRSFAVPVKGQVRKVLPIDIAGKNALLLAKNNDSLRVMRLADQ